MKYPQSWNVKEDGGAYVYFYPKDESDYQNAISIWSTDKNTVYNPVLEPKSVKMRDIFVAGQSVGVYKYTRYSTYLLRASIYKTNVDKYVFRFSNSLDRKYEPYFDRLLSSFKFINTPPTGYSDEMVDVKFVKGTNLEYPILLYPQNYKSPFKK